MCYQPLINTTHTLTQSGWSGGVALIASTTQPQQTATVYRPATGQLRSPTDRQPRVVPQDQSVRQAYHTPAEHPVQHRPQPGSMQCLWARCSQPTGHSISPTASCGPCTELLSPLAPPPAPACHSCGGARIPPFSGVRHALEVGLAATGPC